MTACPSGRVHVLRVISRLNIGGPAIQAISLTRLLEPRGYATTLVRGVEEPDEGNMDSLAQELGVQPLRVRSLRRKPGLHDLLAVVALTRLVWRLRPAVVHTHAAKGGAIGRLASLLAPGRRRRVVVHTYHGHSLTGYFSSGATKLYLAIERFLGRRTDRLIAVSEQVRDDLVRLGVAPTEQFEIVPLGLDLSRFDVPDDERLRRRAALRRQLGIPPDAAVVTVIARLVPIKRLDRFLRVATQLNSERSEMRFVVVGDGEQREELHHSPEAQRLGDRLIWTGFRSDIPDVCFASDVVILTSDNEGTPVSLIEAQAAGTPTVGTRVGGVEAVLEGPGNGSVASPDDELGLADAVRRILDDAPSAGAMARRAKRRTMSTFTVDRLVNDIDSLYSNLLSKRAAGAILDRASAAVERC